MDAARLPNRTGVEPEVDRDQVVSFACTHLPADEALRHGVVSRVVAQEALDDAALEIASTIAKAPPFTVAMFRRTLARLTTPLVDSSMQEEAVAQSMVFASHDYAEMKLAREEGREPSYRGR